MLTSSDFQVTMSTNSLYQTVRGSKPLYRDATQPQDPHVLPSCLPLKQGSVNITSAKLALYNDFRTKEYDPNSQVVPWTVKLPGAVDPVSNWRKTVRPSASDYKPFKDEAYWIRYNRTLCVHDQSHGLEHLIDPDYVVKDAALDQLQRCWL
jgi:hypothetical protein